MLNATTRMLARCMYKHEIKLYLRTNFKIGARMCENIISRARSDMLVATGETKESHRSKALAFWESIIRNPKLSERTKMQARREIDSLLGLRAPLEHRHAGSEESDKPMAVVTEVVVTTREEAQAVLRMQELATHAGEDQDN